MTRNRIFAIAAVTAFALVGCSDSNAPSQPEQHQQANDPVKEQAARAAIREFARQTGGDTSWMTAIARTNATLFQPFYAVDLEDVWLIDRAVVFAGALENVSSETGSDYLLSITASDVQIPEVRLAILCAKSKVSPILAAIKSDNASVQPGGVVVAAKITKVKSATEFDKEGTKTVFYEQGHCVDIAYLGDAMSLMITADVVSAK